MLLDDRWASAREDLVRIWLMEEGEIDANWPHLSERFEGAGHVVATQATWWQGKSLGRRPQHPRLAVRPDRRRRRKSGSRAPTATKSLW